MKGFSGFKESPVKQKPGGSVGEALEHHKKYKAKTSIPKDFNIKGSQGSTTPGYSTTKVAKEAAKKGIGQTLKKIVPAVAIATTLHDFYKSGQKHSDRPTVSLGDTPSKTYLRVEALPGGPQQRRGYLVPAQSGSSRSGGFAQPGRRYPPARRPAR